jgi:hypothetical protein
MAAVKEGGPEGPFLIASIYFSLEKTAVIKHGGR